MTPAETVRVATGGLLLIAVVVAALGIHADPAPDASEPIARETDDGLLVTEALDTAYAESAPAPNEPVWRDSFAHCRARLSFHGDTRWREAMGVEP